MNKNDLSKPEQLLLENAVTWAKRNKTKIARELTNKEHYSRDDEPAAFFMAGCPAAGKTEVARALAKIIGEKNNTNGDNIMRIDPDEVRESFPSYNGLNSSLFQYPTSIIVDKAFDMIMKNKQSFILDGTLSNTNIALSNIKRCIDKGYFICILFVYNHPINAWEAACAREARDGRKINIDVFVDRYFKSKETVRIIKKEFGNRINIDLLLKDLKADDVSFKFNIDDIDNHIPEQYTPASLKNTLLKQEDVHESSKLK
tara:strand:- start:4314 stop:5087 length:774 start_codon:yes stop_codon:yes gene_type:complete